VIRIGKYDFIKTENIVSVHKLLKLEYEKDYSGQKQELLVKVYPYTVEEKLELTNLNKKLQKLLKQDNYDEKEVEILNEEIMIKSALYVLKKDDPSVDEEIVKKMPKDWRIKLSYKALEFEGFEEDQLKKLSKKEIDKSVA